MLLTQQQQFIPVRCADCGHGYEVGAAFAGAQLECLSCGGVVDVPGLASRPRVCSVCTKDLNQLQRIRDESGNYYCQDCWDTMLAGISALPPAARNAKMKSLGQTWREFPPRRARKSELAYLMWKVAGLNWNAVPVWGWILILAALGVLTWYVPRTGTLVAAVLFVPGLFLVIFTAWWEYGLPFRDGIETGMRYWKDKAFRGEWWENNRDYRIRRPGVLAIKGALMVALGIGFYILSNTRHEQMLEDQRQAERTTYETRAIDPEPS